MITNNSVKYVHSLSVKKYRDEHGCFVAEGPKVVSDLLPLLKCKTLFSTKDFLEKQNSFILNQIEEIVVISQKELERLSLLRSPRDVLAVFYFPEWDGEFHTLCEKATSNLCIALDGVQDPGNLGTIIRIADWFGIEEIFASQDTVDVYSPKVIQATMGAVGRVHVHYMDLNGFFEQLPDSVPIYGTFLDGTNIYQESVENSGIIVMGNEGKGISKQLAGKINRRLLIPNFPKNRETSESLNVAVATAIVCAEFRRRALR